LKASRSTILINAATRERLKRHGLKGETYDEVINKLCEFYERHKDSVEKHKIAVAALAGVGATALSVLVSDSLNAAFIFC
jgi:hypothetical protein